MRILIVILMFFSSNSWAMKPLPMLKLTPELSKEHDFRISFKVTNTDTVIYIAAPSEIDSCSYRSNFTELLNSDGKVIATTQTTASVTSGEVHFDGSFSDSALDMRLGVTYICLPNSGKRGKIYLVDSIKKYLISTQQ